MSDYATNTLHVPTRLFQVSLLGKTPSLLYAVTYFPRIHETHLLSAIYRIRTISIKKHEPYPMLKLQSTQLTKQNKFFEVYFRLDRINGNYAKSCVSPRPSMESLLIFIQNL